MAEIVKVAGIVEPLRAYNFLVRVVRAPGGVSFLDGFEFRVKSVSIPEQSFDVIEVPFRWYRWFVPGREAMDKSVELTWWEGEDLAIYKNLWTWRELVGGWLSAGAPQGKKSEISGEVRISLLDGRENELDAYLLKNAFLVTLGAVELTYEDSRVVEVRATFRFDWLERG